MILRTALALFLQILSLLLLARVLLSWFRPRYRTGGNRWFFGIDELVWRATEPLLAPIRNILPTSNIGMDFSPIIVWILLQLVAGWLGVALF